MPVWYFPPVSKVELYVNDRRGKAVVPKEYHVNAKVIVYLDWNLVPEDIYHQIVHVLLHDEGGYLFDEWIVEVTREQRSITLETKIPTYWYSHYVIASTDVTKVVNAEEETIFVRDKCYLEVCTVTPKTIAMTSIELDFLKKRYMVGRPDILEYYIGEEVPYRIYVEALIQPIEACKPVSKKFRIIAIGEKGTYTLKDSITITLQHFKTTDKGVIYRGYAEGKLRFNIPENFYTVYAELIE